MTLFAFLREADAPPRWCALIISILMAQTIPFSGMEIPVSIAGGDRRLIGRRAEPEGAATAGLVLFDAGSKDDTMKRPEQRGEIDLLRQLRVHSLVCGGLFRQRSDVSASGRLSQP